MAAVNRDVLTDIRGNPIFLFDYEDGSYEVVTATGTSARTATNATPLFWVVNPEVSVHVRQGDGTVVATVTDSLLVAGTTFHLPRKRGSTRIAFIKKAGAADGPVNVWHADLAGGV